MKIQENIPLSEYTTLKIGGQARFFVEVEDKEELKEAILFAKKNKLPFLVIGSGSNLLVADAGFGGLVIKNSMEGIKISGTKVWCTAGTILQDLVDVTIKKGLSGMESLTDIPGTVGGAVYGNAGAYGQTISEYLIQVLVWDGEREFWLPKSECGFDYRESNFKARKNLIILACEFKLQKGNKKELKKKADEILKMRRQRYHPGLRCPGSFFKNVIANHLTKEILAKIPKEKIIYGKVPAGYLLEQVGAKGAKLGGAEVADYHGNLFINKDHATAKDFYTLAMKFQEKVKEKFGIQLEPEVQLVGF